MTKHFFGDTAVLLGRSLRHITRSVDLEEVADLMAAGLAEQAHASGEINPGDVAHDGLPFDLLDALAVESDPRSKRLLDLMRERGWVSWTRPERLAEPPG